MAHTGIFATSDEILFKAGANVDSAGATEARINALCLQVESFINDLTVFNFSDAYAALNADVKHLLSMLESDIIAIYLIHYNMRTYSSLEEAQTILDVLTDRVRINTEVIKNKDTQPFMSGVT